MNKSGMLAAFNVYNRSGFVSWNYKTMKGRGQIMRNEMDYTMTYGEESCEHKKGAQPKYCYKVYYRGYYQGTTWAVSEEQAANNVRHRERGDGTTDYYGWSAECLTDIGPKHEYRRAKCYEVFHKVNNRWVLIGSKWACSPEDAINAMFREPWARYTGVDGKWGARAKKF